MAKSKTEYVYHWESPGQDLVLSSSELLEELLTKHLVSESRSFAISRRSSYRPPFFERLLYRVLGLDIPCEESALIFSAGEQGGSLNFTKDDAEWISLDCDTSELSGEVELKTLNGEPFRAAARQVVSFDLARQAALEFFARPRKPQSVNWKRNT